MCYPCPNSSSHLVIGERTQLMLNVCEAPLLINEPFHCSRKNCLKTTVLKSPDL